MDKVEQQEMDTVLRELARLTPMEYDTLRDEKAKELGVRVKTLDTEVAKYRLEVAEQQSGEVVEELSPWEEPVDGDVLLREIKRQIEAHVVLESGETTAAAMWSFATFCLDAFRLFPKLHIKSPEKRCGKSTLMECLEGVTCRPLMTANITPAALFRSIEAWKPTLLIDEADTFAKDNDELNGIINAGHTRRQAFVLRTVKVNEDIQPRKFIVWGAQVIAGIKNQRDTLEDRSITIELRRKKPTEQVEKISFEYYECNQALRSKCLRWAEDNIENLKKSAVEVPPCGNDRAEDNWFPLFAIAGLVGGEWPELVQAAYLAIEQQADDKGSAAVMLLSDVKAVFDEKGVDRIHSENLVSALVAMDDRPWSEWKRGYPMTKSSLSKLLAPHKIKPKQIRIGELNRNGYERKCFEDAFERYLSGSTPAQNSTTLQPSNGADFSGFQNSTQTLPVEFQNGTKLNKYRDCRDVEFLEGGNGEDGGMP